MSSFSAICPDCIFASIYYMWYRPGCIYSKILSNNQPVRTGSTWKRCRIFHISIGHHWCYQHFISRITSNFRKWAPGLVINFTSLKKSTYLCYLVMIPRIIIVDPCWPYGSTSNCSHCHNPENKLSCIHSWPIRGIELNLHCQK